MKLKVFNENNKLTETYTDEKYIVTKLLALLFNKAVVGNRWITKTTYKYNYTNLQTVKFNLNNGYKLEFIDVPTSGTTLNEGAIEKILKEGGVA